MKSLGVEPGRVRVFIKTVMAMLTYFILLTLLLQPFIAGF